MFTLVKIFQFPTVTSSRKHRIRYGEYCTEAAAAFQSSLPVSCFQILSSQKSGDRDLFTRKFVDDRIDVDGHVRIFFAELVCDLLYDRCRQQSGCKETVCFRSSPVRFSISSFTSSRSSRIYADAILKLKITVILFRRRKWLSCQNIPFIRSMDKMDAVFLISLLLPSMDQIQYFLCIFFIKGSSGKSPS